MSKKESTKQIERYKNALWKIVDIYESDHFGRQTDAFFMASCAAAVLGKDEIRCEDMPTREVNGQPSCYYPVAEHIKKMFEE